MLFYDFNDLSGPKRIKKPALENRLKFKKIGYV